jgi:signal recognition particle receptor subunit beta
MARRVLWCGHVDAGKSTLCGHLLYTLGVFSDHDLAQAERTAQDKKLSGWKYAYLLDILTDEQERGKTRDYCETPCTLGSKEFVFVDTPGHHAFLRHMIEGAEGATAALWVVSVRPSETEKSLADTEHLLLLRCLGVQHLVIVLNKCDLMEEDVLETVKTKTGQIAKKYGFGPAHVSYCCVSGWTGAGLTTPGPWGGVDLATTLTSLPPPKCDPVAEYTTDTLTLKGMVTGDHLITPGLVLVLQGSRLTLEVEVERVVSPTKKPFARQGEQATLSLRFLQGTTALCAKRFILRNGDATVFLGVV